MIILKVLKQLDLEYLAEPDKLLETGTSYAKGKMTKPDEII